MEWGGVFCARVGCGHRDLLFSPVVAGFNRRPPPDVFLDAANAFRFPLCVPCAREFELPDRCGLCSVPTYDACTRMGLYSVCTLCLDVLADYVRVARAGDISLSSEFRRWINDAAGGLPAGDGMFPETTRVVNAYLHDRSLQPTLYEMRCIPARERLRAMGLSDYLSQRVISCIGPDAVGRDMPSVIEALVNKCNI